MKTKEEILQLIEEGWSKVLELDKNPAIGQYIWKSNQMQFFYGRISGLLTAACDSSEEEEETGDRLYQSALQKAGGDETQRLEGTNAKT